MLIYFNSGCLLYNDMLVILLCHIGWQLVQLGITALLFASCCLEIVDYGGGASGILFASDFICINILNKLGAKLHKFPHIKSLQREVIIASLCK